jgi:hypothetical protein
MANCKCLANLFAVGNSMKTGLPYAKKGISNIEQGMLNTEAIYQRRILHHSIFSFVACRAPTRCKYRLNSYGQFTAKERAG